MNYRAEKDGISRVFVSHWAEMLESLWLSMLESVGPL